MIQKLLMIHEENVNALRLSTAGALYRCITKDADGINAGSHNYHKREIARKRLTMTRIQVKRLKYLMYWVQDLHIYQENYDFLDVINQQQFLYGVGEYLHQHGTRKKCCKYRHWCAIEEPYTMGDMLEDFT